MLAYLGGDEGPAVLARRGRCGGDSTSACIRWRRAASAFEWENRCHTGRPAAPIPAAPDPATAPAPPPPARAAAEAARAKRPEACGVDARTPPTAVVLRRGGDAGGEPPPCPYSAASGDVNGREDGT